MLADRPDGRSMDAVRRTVRGPIPMPWTTSRRLARGLEGDDLAARVRLLDRLVEEGYT